MKEYWTLLILLSTCRQVAFELEEAEEWLGRASLRKPQIVSTGSLLDVKVSDAL